MAKALFNADCDSCLKFKPRCASVFHQIPKIRGGIPVGRGHLGQPTIHSVFCDDCRRVYRGKFVLDDRHK